MTTNNKQPLLTVPKHVKTMTTPKHRFLHCDWLQPRATLQKMNTFISSCSHIAVASQSQSQ